MITYVAYTILVILFAYFFLRMIYGFNKKQMQGRNIRFVEKLMVTNDKSIGLIEVKDNYYLVSITKNDIRLIDKLDDLEILPVKSENSFDHFLAKKINKLRDKNEN